MRTMVALFVIRMLMEFRQHIQCTYRRAPWTTRRSNQSILKKIDPEYSLEGLMLKLKLQYFGHLIRRANSGKHPDAGKDWRQEKGTAENETAEWHHWLNGHECEQIPGDSGHREGNGTPLQYSCLETPRDGGVKWWMKWWSDLAAAAVKDREV